MRFSAILLVTASTLVLSTFLIGCSATVTEDAAPAITGTVTIVIDGGGETIEHKVEDVKEGTTVEQLMRELGDETIKISGSGSTAMLTSLQGQPNVGMEGWTYKVNEEWADRSMGDYELTPPATVLWKYGTFAEMNE